MRKASGYRGRFAPSPTGPLHMGSLCAALASWLHARQHEGVWLVRIEDLDPPREIAGAAALQLASLARHGLVSDEEVIRQSTRSEAYDVALENLAKAGRSFPCSCSRSQLGPFSGRHSHCLREVDPRHHAIRFRVDAQPEIFEDALYGRQYDVLTESCGDFVIKRADGHYAYQLAVVVDDAAQGITDIVRGVDLLSSTARQRVLQRALGLPHPATLHLPLVLDEHGRKLSKSQAAWDIDREYPPRNLREAWYRLGQDPRQLPHRGGVETVLESAIRHFDIGAIPAIPPPADARQSMSDV